MMIDVLKWGLALYALVAPPALLLGYCLCVAAKCGEEDQLAAFEREERGRT